jgi:hypothetical protein
VITESVWKPATARSIILFAVGCALTAFGCEFFQSSDTTAESDPGALGGAGSAGSGPSTGGDPGFSGGGAATGGSTQDVPLPSNFTLQPEFSGPCTLAPGAIEINLGNSAEAFVRSVYCQVNGTEPATGTTDDWANRLRTLEYVRRIDVARTFCQNAGRTCAFSYSDPWSPQIPLSNGCSRKGSRDLGAVLMFFSACPFGVNCGMDWANTHALGMAAIHELLGFGTAKAGYYNPRNAGFWRRELLDARWAGLQFFLLNVYGPDLAQTPDPLAQLAQALADAGPDVKIGLFDDTWAWGQASSPPSWQTPPDLADPENAAQTLYQAKWKPFFSRVERPYWYLLQNRPFIYFYNAGRLRPLNASAAVIARMKQLFQQDFGVEPFVAVDGAYFADTNMPSVADSRFTWDTLHTGQKSRSTLRGVTLDHFMVKRDSIGRDRPGTIATSADTIIKGTDILQQMLASSQDANVAVIATWNDIGEGTGISRNVDYYVRGEWLRPDAFLSLTRATQCAQ